MLVAIAAPVTPSSGKRSQTKNQAWVEDQVDAIGDPQRPHGPWRVANSPKYCVTQKQEHHHCIRTDQNASVVCADLQHLRVGAHHAEQVRRKHQTDHAQDDTDAHSQQQCLYASPTGARPVALAPSSRDDGGRRHRQPKRQRINQNHQRLGEAYRGHRRRTETAPRRTRRQPQRPTPCPSRAPSEWPAAGWPVVDHHD